MSRIQVHNVLLLKDNQTIPNHGSCGSDHQYNIQKEIPDT